MAGRLVVIKGYDRDKALEIKAACTYCIGRGGAGKAVDFKVDPCEHLTSRQHFFIDYLPPRFFVRDNNSTNGTLIQRGNTTLPVLGEQIEVFDGDRIIAGNTVFKLEATGEAYEIPVIKSPAMEICIEPPADQLVNSKEVLSEGDIMNPEGVCSENIRSMPNAYGHGESIILGDMADPVKQVSTGAVIDTPSQPKLSPHSVVVQEIQLFNDTQVKCFSCGAPVPVEITTSEMQSNGYPVFMCDQCSLGFSFERNLKDLEDYRILREIREDGMGLVYLGRHQQTGLLVEIRAIFPRLSTEDSLSVKREISSIKDVSHPNLVRMYENVVYRDRIYLIYEYMPEGDLLHFLEARSSDNLSWNDACTMVCDVLTGLRHCHELGIVHGNIRPENILFKKNPSGHCDARLGDLGLAWICETTGLSGSLTSGCRQTQVYKAPEFERYRALKAQADVYSVGIIFYGLLNGDLLKRSDLFDQKGSVPGEASLSIVPLIAKNPEIPWALTSVVEKAIRKNPDERFKNASDMLQALLQMRF
ncbi:MAG: protein kinase [Thermoclostridium sp.]|nr:protein kinase [Thermoclostridium sp.]